MNRTISEDDKMKSNYAEYLVRVRKNGKLTLRKLGIILLALLLIGAGFIFVISKMAAFMLPIVVGTAALCWFLWRYTSVEYEYIIISATVEFYKIYGERDRKKILEFATKDIEKVAPLSAHPEVSSETYAESYDFTDGTGKDVFFVKYSGEKGKGIVYINVIKKTLDAFRYYRSTAVEYGDVK